MLVCNKAPDKTDGREDGRVYVGSPLGDKARVFGAGRGGDMVAGTRGSWSQCISSQEAEAAGRMLVPKSNFPFSTQAGAYLSTHVEIREQICGGGSPSRDQTAALRFGGKPLYPLSCFRF